MGLIKEIIQEFCRLVESLTGKRTVESWMRSVSDSADSLILKIEDRDGVQYDSGKLNVFIKEDGLTATMILNFKNCDEEIVTYETSRDFKKKYFLTGELERAFNNEEETYPIANPK